MSVKVTLALIGGLTAGALGAGWLLHELGVPDVFIGVAAPGILLSFQPLSESLTRRRTSIEDRVADLIVRHSLQTPWLVGAYVLIALEFVERLTGATFGLAIGLALGQAGSTTNATAQVVATTVPVFTVIVLAVAIAVAATYATHRIPRLPLLWMAAVILIQQGIDVAVEVLLFGIPIGPSVLGQLVVVALLLPGLLVGNWWGRRTRRAYWMSQLYKELSPADQRDLIGLVETLPGVQRSRSASAAD
jgi:hypothetical protein